LPAHQAILHSFIEFCGLPKFPHTVTPYCREYDTTDLEIFLGWSKLTNHIFQEQRTHDERMELVRATSNILTPYKDMLENTQRRGARMLFTTIPVLCLDAPLDWAATFRHALEQRNHKVLFLYGGRNTHVATVLFAVRLLDCSVVNVADVGRALSDVFRWNKQMVNLFVPIAKNNAGETWAIAAAHVAFLRLSKLGGEDTGLFGKHPGDVGSIPPIAQEGPDGGTVHVKHRGDVGTSVMSYQMARLLLDPLAIVPFQREIRESFGFDCVSEDKVEELGRRYLKAGYPVDLVPRSKEDEGPWVHTGRYATGVSILFTAKRSDLRDPLVAALDALVRDRKGRVETFSRADDISYSCTVHVSIIFPGPDASINVGLLGQDIRRTLKRDSELQAVSLLSLVPLDANMPRKNPLALAIAAGHFPTPCQERERLMDLLFNARCSQMDAPADCSRASSPMRTTTEPPPVSSRGPSTPRGRSLSRPRAEDDRPASRQRVGPSPPRPEAMPRLTTAPADPRLKRAAVGVVIAYPEPRWKLQADEIARAMSPHKELRDHELLDIAVEPPGWTCSKTRFIEFLSKPEERDAHAEVFLNQKVRQLVNFQFNMSLCSNDIGKASRALQILIEKPRLETFDAIAQFVSNAHGHCLAFIPFVQSFAGIGPLINTGRQSEAGKQRVAALQAGMVEAFQTRPAIPLVHVAPVMLRVREDNQLRQLHDCLCKANEIIYDTAPDPRPELFWDRLDWVATAAKLRALTLRLDAARMICAGLARL
jgi:hypothetical protein